MTARQFTLRAALVVAMLSAVSVVVEPYWARALCIVLVVAPAVFLGMTLEASTPKNGARRGPEA